MKTILLAAALLLSALPAIAADIQVSGAFMRAAPVAGGNGAAFLTVTNHGADDRLVSAEASISRTVELHTHVKDGDVFRMRKVESIAVPAHGAAELKPGGDHIMFIGLTAPAKEGTKVALTLVFEKAGKIEVDVPVLAPGAMGAAMPMPMHGGHMKH
ncbi:hypothetical protein A6A04_14400 [Paramagnetospirillum marisnigri]|uniref:Copper chaperone PCu(A)C n=1 Tax=Paramagnetospirillum marisnigri TaxID=1285242 RepID=A0A178MU92_9PROT|nr:copper chaperone PCu(A)C [Paramagnetospirillum marisnigri]OAN53145.1 hypothetical protein A6A04_14400 [Paramagnetospirillum marisnigri]